MGNQPNTPAELPMNEPRRVTELSMLLIRRRVLDTARGRKAPSRNPQAPPIPRPKHVEESDVDEYKVQSALESISPAKYVVPVP
jgi:hypothetical protein